MGFFFGSEEQQIEEKAIDSTGHVNTNIIVQEARDTHHQMVISQQLLNTTYALVIIETIKLCLCLFNAYKKKIKKTYRNNANNGLA